ncbi:MAG: fumarylacetoacetate hydrolase family protein [Candidatus Helarchaeota archaeon]|nr:fumarylacetoacetate hydrolase family protein [Candidatus Helarchaeota archaeon]
MKFVNLQQNGKIKCGLLIGSDQILELRSLFQHLGKDPSLVESDSQFFYNYLSMKDMINTFLEKANFQGLKLINLSEVKLLSPDLHPSKIVCLGLNYKAHAMETGQKLPKLPMLFSKASTAVIGMAEVIHIPKLRGSITGSAQPIALLDYEVELAIIIGKTCKGVSIQDAPNYILGYTILNDVSARMEQMNDKQYFRSKSFDTFAPLGPWIVSSDSIGDPMNLHIECRVNKELRQNSNTNDMNFNVYETVSFISEAITLLPGDIIGTGTPAGVGAGRKPPLSLKVGDVIEMSIENIGLLRNYVQD